MVDVTSTSDLKALLAKKAAQPPTAGTTGQVLTRDTSSTTGTVWQTPAASTGGGTPADATTTSKGIVQLAGDLAGTAANPTLKQVNASAQTYGDSYNIPRVTVDTAGRVTAVTPVAVGGAPNATSSANGVVRLAGDLAGTASSPALVTTGVTAGTYSFSSIQSITVDAKGRITSITTTSTSTLSNTNAPALTGTPTVGQTLTVSNGTWSPAPDAYTYRWYRSGNVISGQTAQTYTLATADTGYQVSAQVTAQKSGYTPTTASSPAVTVAAAGGGGGSVVSPAYYVSTSGSDSNDGSAGNPFRTLEKARDAMRGGSTKFTYLRGGTHARSSKLTLQTADSGTKWVGYPGETPVVDGGGSLVDAFFVDAGTTGVTVDRVTFQNMTNCAIHLNGYVNLEINSCVISNCTFRNIASDGQYGAGNGGAVRLTFCTKNNTIRNNLFQDMYCPGVSIAGGGTQEYNQGTKILNNRFLRMNNAGQADTGSIYMLDRGHNGDQNNPTVIDYNYVEDAGTDTETKLFYLDDNTSCVTVTNNIFAGRSHWAFQLHGSDHVTISNNIFDMSDPKWPADYYMGLYQDVVGAGFTNFGMGANVFTKNIAYTSKQYQQGSMWQWQDQTNGQIAKPSVYNNLYYSAAGTLPYDKGVVTDSNPKVGNPMFTNAAGRDYSFTSNSGYSQIGFTPINQALIGPQA